MKHLLTAVGRTASTVTVVVFLLAGSGSGCVDGTDGSTSGALESEVDSTFRDMEKSVESLITRSRYGLSVREGILTVVNLETGERQHMPADIFARSGRQYADLIGLDEAANVGVNPDDGTYSLGGRLEGSLTDLVLIAISSIFAIAFLLSGFLLLRMARQRRLVNESRIRQLRAREAERTHLAAELHDGPVQELQFVLRSYLGALTKTAMRNATEIVDIQQKLESVTAALRNICTELRPPILAHFGLAYAVRSHADKFEQRLPNTTLYLDIVEDEVLDDDELSLAFFRIFQESLTNVEKHSGAGNVWLKLHIDAKWVELVIRDDGGGFHPPRRLEELEVDGHLGLSGLSQRAEAVGAVFEVRSSPGSGTTITVVARRTSSEDRPAPREGIEVA